MAFRLLPLAGSLAALSGCAITSTAPAGLPDPVAFSGQVIGGENPISGATVSFYETAATGVATNGVYVPGTPLTPLGSTVTDANGNFAFSTALVCSSSNDYVYATAAGGNTGSGINPDSLLMSTVGSCNGFGATSFVVINELSTVAAAYALQGFTSVSGSYATGTSLSITAYSLSGNVATFTTSNTLTVGQTVIVSGFTTSTFLNGTYIVQSASGSQFTVNLTHANASATEAGTANGLTLPVVSVTASATNYATVSTTAGSLSAAGLAHAFANAANLKTPSSAVANSSIPGQPKAIVPAALINALGNSLQACVNSTGGSVCGNLFTYTTNPQTSVVPSNTLSAVLNIARFPTQNVYNICELAAAQAPFAPALTCAGSVSAPTAPRDWSIAIVYPTLYGATTGTTCSTTNGSSSSNGLCYPLFIAMDMNDTAYVLNGSASTITATNVVAISSSGTPLWASALDTTDIVPEMIAADGLGNVFYTNNGTTTGTGNLLQLQASSGTAETTITGYEYLYGIAIDSSNKLWVGQHTAVGNQNLVDFTRNSTGSGYTYGSLAGGVIPDEVADYDDQIALDQNLNIWLSDYSSSAAESPTIYPSSHTAAEFAVSSSTTFENGYGMAIDSNGNGWADSSTGIYKIVPTESGGVISAASITLMATYTPPGGTASLRYLAVDGNNTIWVADDNSAGSDTAVVGYPSAAPSPALFSLRPCIDAAGTTCGAASTYGPYASHQAVPDSTGSLWVASDASGTVEQIIGVAAPTWPLLSVLKPGVMP